MGVSSVIYANTGAYVALNGMLTAERYQRLIDCTGDAELQKRLSEFGFEGDTTDEMLSRALDEVYAYLDERSPVEGVRAALLKKNDYHNAKVTMKCKYARREDFGALLYPHGGIDTDKMKEWVFKDDYSLLPRPMAAALADIDLRFSKGDRSGRVVDCRLNRAMYEDIFQTLGAGHGEMKGVFRAEADLCNVSAALRVRVNGLREADLAEEFLPGGQIPFDTLRVLLDGTPERVRDAFSHGAAEEYRDIVSDAMSEAEKGAMPDFERVSDNFIIRVLKKYKDSNSHYMMFYGYVLARLYELKNIRIVCAGVRAGEPKKKIHAKLRETYV